MDVKKSASNNDSKKDYVEIPVGKFFSGLGLSNIRNNPWIAATIVLAIALILVSVFGGGAGIVSGDTAGRNLISFINSQGNGEASLVSSVLDGSFYLVTVNYNGNDIPVRVTVDGKYLVSDYIPLTSDSGSSLGDNSGSTERKVVPSVSLDDDAVLGNKNAPITIIEFSDYQCPFCERFWSQTLPLIKSEYIDSGKVKFVYRDFPLSSIHPQAQKAAEATECVREQLKDSGFWNMHDKIFENQASLSADNLKKWALEVGVNPKQFNDCLDSGKYADEVANDLSYGSSLGVQGTPGFFVGNDQSGYSVFEGAEPFASFKEVIDSYLVA